jgi:hypothetical protein
MASRVNSQDESLVALELSGEEKAGLTEAMSGYV